MFKQQIEQVDEEIIKMEMQLEKLRLSKQKLIEEKEKMQQILEEKIEQNYQPIEVQKKDILSFGIYLTKSEKIFGKNYEEINFGKYSLFRLEKSN